MKYSDLPQLPQEHYQVARSFDGIFTASEFREQYKFMFPERSVGSILPSDYATNNNQARQERHYKFLEIVSPSTYRFTGLVAEKKDRNPDWTRDEIILALEFYLMHRDTKIPSKTSAAINDLADEVRAIAHALGLSGDETFRNTNGVYMKVMNLRSKDPVYTSQGKVGLSRSNKHEDEVWERFGDDPAGLHAAAAVIRAQIAAGTESVTFGYDEPEVEEAPEGRLITRLHRTRERSHKLVAAKKKSFLKKQGSLFCEACSFDFGKVYGERGEGFIECHHTKPIHQMKPGEKTKQSDLALVCANCHRMIHAKQKWLSVSELKALLR